MQEIIRIMLSTIFPAALLVHTGFDNPANADIAQVPLETVIVAKPNILFFIDNSPSMGSMAGHPDFDPAIEYSDWQFIERPLSNDDLIVDDDAVFLDRLQYGSCPVGFVQGTHGSLMSCLSLREATDERTQYSRNYLGFLFDTFPSGTDLDQQQEDGSWLIPGHTRFTDLKRAAKQLAIRLQHARLCVASFSQDTDELELVQQCTEDSEQVRQMIDTIRVKPTGETPIGKAYLQIREYFQGTYGSEAQQVEVRSPVEFRCQGNGIVVFSDGIEISRESEYQGLVANLESAAFYAKHSDLFPAEDADEAGRSFGDWNATPFDENAQNTDPFLLQNIIGFFVSSPGSQEVLGRTAEHIDSLIVDANQVDVLGTYIQQQLRSHRRENSSVSPLATAMNRDGSSIIYRSAFDTGSWSGSIHAFRPRITTDGTVEFDSLWNSSDLLPPHGSRNVVAIVPDGAEHTGITEQSSLKPVPFDWDHLEGFLPEVPDYSAQLVRWLRGDRRQEQNYGGVFRDREHVLGDLVHSNPVVLPIIPDQAYPDIDYRNFIDQMRQLRTYPVVFVGGNDGFLHGFSEIGGGSKEILALAPWSLMPYLPQLADPNYRHRFFFDGPLTLIDAKIGEESDPNPWRSVLLGAYGAGAKGLIALDVTNPNELSPTSLETHEDLFLWEINPGLVTESENPNPPYSSLGHIMSPVSVGRVRNPDLSESWYAITGNGIGDDSNRSLIYVIDLKTGRPIHILQVPAGAEAGITSVTPIDLDEDSFMDRFYATDRLGQIWRFDWEQDQARFESHYQSDGTPIPLFTASGLGPNSLQLQSQPIYGGLEVGQLPGKGTEEGLILYFGTGQMHTYSDLDQGSASTRTVNSIYGLWDNGLDGNLNRSSLVTHHFIESQESASRFRSVAGNAPRFDDEETRGWVIDLPGHLEQVLFAPKLVHGRIQFTTIEGAAPRPDPCTSKPGSWIIEVDAITGLDPKSPVFDINNDQQLNQQDRLMGDAAPSGTKPDVGSASPPAIVQVENNGDKTLIRISSDRDGGLIQTNSVVGTKRISWRLLD